MQDEAEVHSVAEASVRQCEDILQDITLFTQLSEGQYKQMNALQSEYRCLVEVLKMWTQNPSALSAYTLGKLPALLHCLRSVQDQIDVIRSPHPCTKSISIGIRGLLREDGERLRVQLTTVETTPLMTIAEQATPHDESNNDENNAEMSNEMSAMDQYYPEDDEGVSTKESMNSSDLPESALHLADLTVSQVLSLLRKEDFADLQDWALKHQMTGVRLLKLPEFAKLDDPSLLNSQLQRLLSKIEEWKECAILVHEGSTIATDETALPPSDIATDIVEDKGDISFDIGEFLQGLQSLSEKQIVEGFAHILSEVLKGNQALNDDLIQANILVHVLKYLKKRVSLKNNQDEIEATTVNYLLRTLNACFALRIQSSPSSEAAYHVVKQLQQLEADDFLLKYLSCHGKNFSAMRSVFGLLKDCCSVETDQNLFVHRLAKLHVILPLEKYLRSARKDISTCLICIKLLHILTISDAILEDVLAVGMVRTLFEILPHHYQHAEVVSDFEATLPKLIHLIASQASDKSSIVSANIVLKIVLEQFKATTSEDTRVRITLRSLLTLLQSDQYMSKFKATFLQCQGSQLLLDVLQSQLKYVDIVLLVMKVLLLALHCNEVKEQVGNMGGCKQLVFVLQYHYERPDIVSLACQVIASLAKEFENTILIADANGGDILLQILAMYQEHRNVAMELLLALQNLVLNEDTSLQILSLAGQNLLFQVLALYQDDQEMVQCICFILSFLSKQGKEQTLQDREGKIVLSTNLLLQLFKSNDQVILLMVCKIITEVACVEAVAKQILQPPSTMSEKLVGLLRIHKDDAELVEGLCQAMWTLAIHCPNPFYALPTCKLLFSCLSTYPNNTLLVEAAAGCLSCLSLTAKGQQQIENCHGYSNLLRCLSSNLGDEDAVLQLSFVLKLMQPSEKVFNQVEPGVQHEVIIIQALRDYQNKDLIAQNLCHFIKQVAYNVNGCNKLVDNKLLELLGEMLDFLDNPALLAAVCGVVRVLCFNISVAEKFRKMKGLDRLITLLKNNSEYPEVVMEVCATLWESCHGFNDRMYLGSIGACAEILSIIRTYQHDAKVLLQATRALIRLIQDCPNNLHLVQDTQTSTLLQHLLVLHKDHTTLEQYIMQCVLSISDTRNPTPAPVQKRIRTN